jgi:polyisoprenoid-binding protein YceI
MYTRIWTTAVILILLTLALAGCGLLQAPEEASGPIEAVPLVVEAAPTTPVEAAVEASEVEEGPVQETVVQEEPADVPAGGLVIYTISQDASQVRFELDEDLRGQRITVVGVTDQVAGELAMDLDDLSTVQVGVLQINARTLVTDNDFRNRAIQNQILNTSAYEFITFTPTAVSGLPSGAAVGEEIRFQIEGDLTIRDMTQPVVFEVTATAVSATQITGSATAVIERDAFGLRIPSVPSVANVEEEIELIIEFVANAAT